MASKHGQLTLFLAAGLILLIGMVLFLTVYSSRDTNINLEKSPVEMFVQSCVENVGKDALVFVGLQGGYYITPDPALAYSSIKVPVFWDVDHATVPSTTRVETELAGFVESNLPVCLGNLSEFKSEGYIIDQGKVTARATIAKEQAIFNVVLPLRIARGNVIMNLHDFEAPIPSRIYDVLAIVQLIENEQKLSPRDMPIGYVTDLAYTNGFTFETTNPDKNDVILTLVFDSEQNKSAPSMFSFAARYDWTGGTP